jgi:cell surface protein SprA
MKLLLIVFTFFVAIVSYGQDTLTYPIENNIDPTQSDPQRFDLGDPSSVKQTIVYDPVSGKYIFTETIGDPPINFRPPSMMTFEEYIEYQREKSKELNWKENIDEQTASARPVELPIKVDSKVFENFFGSDEITIRPQGSVELSFGVNSSRYDNPLLPQKQRKITRFDFQQQIQMNLVGQIGTKLKIGTSYNTQAAFDFDNISKLEYAGNEDQIMQKIALGNVSMPLPTSLIQGSQTLFGAYTQLKFGRATVDLIGASSKGKRQEINITGKSQVQQFELSADNYEANRHFFLNMYHHDHYDEAMSTLPIINSGVNITRIEVWVTNKTNNIDNNRNIVAFSDIGESKIENCQGNPGLFSPNELPDNSSNALYDWAANNPQIRSFTNAVSALSTQVVAPGPFEQTKDYEKIENARKLNDQEYTYNSLLGYISLNLPLNNDEVLAVAYEYTYKGETYQVGDLSTDGVPGTDALILKLIKPTITNPHNKIWDLMMKNVYSIGAYQVGQQGFRLDILYNNPATSLLVPFFPNASDGKAIDNKQLVTLLEMDKINQNNQPFSDGVFDFAPIQYNGNRAENGGTINARNGRIYFSTIEPFGATLKAKLQTSGYSEADMDRIAYTELYDSTKTAAQQIPSKNRFLFKGEYQSSVSSDIPLNALNVPQGAVTVTAGGIKLIEGQDYTVDYNLGRVKILNNGVLESNTPIKIQIESNSSFGFQAKSLIGSRYNYKFSKNLNVGATWMRMMERPVTQKVDIGSEPYKNNILGFDIAYKTELPFLTKAVDFLPVLSTKEKSTMSFTGEFAHLIPGTPRAINKGGTSYIDDFEGAQSSISLSTPSAWRLASIPQGQPSLFPEASLKTRAAGYNRSLLAWYSIDYSSFLGSSLTPPNVTAHPEMLQDSRMRNVNTNEIFPNTQLAVGTQSLLQVFDLAYYPKERGMYNYDTSNVDINGYWTNPEDRWGGIMRALSTNDFEQTNIEYIQFWMLDPFNDDAENVNPNSFHKGGDLYFNLGNVSEDVLPDSRKSFENGLPVDGSTQNIATTQWALVSTQQVVVNTFDNDPSARVLQDVGLDGYSSIAEKATYTDYVNWVQNNSTLSASAKARMIADPSSDDYNYYLDDDFDIAELDILERYKRYNGMEGNSPTTEMSDTMNAAKYPTQGTNMPDLEDINQDNNLAESESYFQYKIHLAPGDMVVGKNYITSVQSVPHGNTTEKWYQFKVPLKDFETKVNGIQDFRSIRFMRMFLKDFDEEVVLRFARLEFIRGEWRKYNLNLTAAGESTEPEPNMTAFNIGAVNIEENAERSPINYVIPPSIVREVDPSQTYQRQLNEQSLVLDVCNLKDGDARAGYRNVQFDVRTYKKLKMFVHAEEVLKTSPLKNEDLTLFVRLGTDFNENYYEYEFPLEVTPWGTKVPEDIWPANNEMEIVFDDLLDLKMARNKAIENGNSTVSYVIEYSEIDPKNAKRRLKVKGNPNLQGIRTLMIGVRNPGKNDNNQWADDGLDKCAIIWVNELRLTEFVSEGGSAAVAQMQVQAADFASVSVSGNYSGINWGSVESRVQERQRNERIGVDMNSNMQLGQFFGKRARISLPFFYGYSLGIINPEYDPFNPDIRMNEYDLATRKERARLGQDFNERRSYNFTNVRKELLQGATPHFWLISNWSLNYAYSESSRRDFNTKSDKTKVWNSSVNYAYSFNNKPIEPFKKVKFMQKNKWWEIVKDMNLYLAPKNISFSNELIRNYNEREIRNNLYPDYEFAPVYVKQFNWNRKYGFGYDITKNLKLSYSATNRAIFEEGDGRVDRKLDPVGYQVFQDSIRSQLGTFGKTMDYTHDYNVTYNAPFNKIPALNWVSGTFKYGGTYNWQRAPLGQTDFGNIIQNTRTVSISSQMNFMSLYNKVPYFKKVLSNGSSGRGRVTPMTSSDTPAGNRPEKTKTLTDEELAALTPKERRAYHKEKRKEKREEERKKKRKGKVNPVGGFAARLLMSVRNVSGSYSLNDGTLLPGFNQDSRYLGMSNGSQSVLSGFVFGQQGYDVWGRPTGYSVAQLAANNNLLVKNENLNRQHTTTHVQNINLRASLEPMKDLTIELNANRMLNTSTNDFFRWNESTQQFETQSPVQTSTLSYSTVSFNSAFVISNKNNNYSSETFQKLLSNRSEVSRLLGSENANSSPLSSGYYKGYGGSQSEVIMGAFLTSYTNNGVEMKNISPFKNVPLPNWSLTYNGLSKFEFFKKYTKSFVLRHGYSSSVSMSGMQSNLKSELDANGNETAMDELNNYQARMIIQNVSISERFSPLIGVDATWKIKNQGLITKFEFKKDRSATLSFVNNQVTEVLGTEFVIGTGYKFTKVTLPIKKIKPSPVNIRFDLSFRDNLTVIRKVVENTNQITAGQRIISIKSSADYNIGQYVVVQLYYDQTINSPKVSSFPTGNMSCGLRLRFNLAGVN